MAALKQKITALARRNGIDKVGFTSRERLQDAPPSGNVANVLPGARSAVSLAVALDKDAIRGYLSKADQAAHTRDHKLAYMKLRDAALAIHSLLEEEGYEVSSPYPNLEYRKDQPHLALIPPLSHRYVAVAAGIGWLGWSSNIITPEFGAPVVLSSIVTSAELEPDPLIGDDICTNCRLCSTICPSQFMSGKDSTEVSIAGRRYRHSKKAVNLRCLITCSGANGVRNPEARWSTWSYKVLELPGPGNEEAFTKKVFEYAGDPAYRFVRGAVNLEKIGVSTWADFSRQMERALFTCGNCMLICWPDLKDRQKNYELLTSSGRLMKIDGVLKVVHI